MLVNEENVKSSHSYTGLTESDVESSIAIYVHTAQYLHEIV